MNITKTLAAAAIAATVGAFAATAPAQAGSYGYDDYESHDSTYTPSYQEETCYTTYWDGYRYVKIAADCYQDTYHGSTYQTYDSYHGGSYGSSY